MEIITMFVMKKKIMFALSLLVICSGQHEAYGSYHATYNDTGGPA